MEWKQRPRYDEPPSSIRWALGWIWVLAKCRVVGHRWESYRTDDPGWPQIEGMEYEETRYCLRCNDTWMRPTGVSLSLSVSSDTSTEAN